MINIDSEMLKTKISRTLSANKLETTFLKINLGSAVATTLYCPKC